MSFKKALINIPTPRDQNVGGLHTQVARGHATLPTLPSRGQLRTVDLTERVIKKYTSMLTSPYAGHPNTCTPMGVEDAEVGLVTSLSTTLTTKSSSHFVAITWLFWYLHTVFKREASHLTTLIIPVPNPVPHRSEVRG